MMYSQCAVRQKSLEQIEWWSKSRAKEDEEEEKPVMDTFDEINNKFRGLFLDLQPVNYCKNNRHTRYTHKNIIFFHI